MMPMLCTARPPGMCGESELSAWDVSVVHAKNVPSLGLANLGVAGGRVAAVGGG